MGAKSQAIDRHEGMCRGGLFQPAPMLSVKGLEDDMAQERDTTRGERRDEVRRKRRYGPRLHGKRLAELVRNALRKRLGKKG